MGSNHPSRWRRIVNVVAVMALGTGVVVGANALAEVSSSSPAGALMFGEIVDLADYGFPPETHFYPITGDGSFKMSSDGVVWGTSQFNGSSGTIDGAWSGGGKQGPFSYSFILGLSARSFIADNDIPPNAWGMVDFSTTKLASPPGLRVSRSGVISTTGTLPAGTYSLLGTYHDAYHDTGTWVDVVTVAAVGTPIITKISPASGPVEGGTNITIVGSNLQGATKLNFGALSAPKGWMVNGSGTSITSVVSPIDPLATAGTVNVSVTTPRGTATDAKGFTYLAPTITSVTPRTVNPAGGTKVTIHGANLQGEASRSMASL